MLARSLDETPNRIGIPDETAGSARKRGGGGNGIGHVHEIHSSDEGRGNRRTHVPTSQTCFRQKPGRGHLCPSLSLLEQPSIALLNPQPSFCPSASPTFAGLKDHLLLPSARAGSQITRHYLPVVGRPKYSFGDVMCKMPASSSKEGTEVGMQFATFSN